MNFLFQPVAKRLAAWFGTVLLLAGCGGSKAPEAVDIDLFFTAQTHGRLTPCGCFTGQYGGLTRLKTVLGSAMAEGTFGVDIGDALEGPADHQLLRYRQMGRAFAGMDYAALNVGRTEAGLSAEALRRLASESPVPLISANVIDRATGERLLPGWRIIERGGRRIALVGVVDPDGFEDGPGDGLEIERIEICLGRVLPEVKKTADLIVLLAHADEARLTSLAGQFYEVAVVLGGRVSQPAQELRKENRTLVYYTGNESKSFGHLALTWNATGDPAVRHNDIVLLTDKIPEHPDILALAADYRAEVRRTKLAVDDPATLLEGQVPGTRQIAGYAGSESCLSCHPSAAKVWETSAHATAFDALVRRDADADPSCIGCHTVGFGTPTGYRREFRDTKLVGVGCESCHGPGSTHVAQRSAGGTPTFHFRPLGAGDCRKCHHGEFSRPFDWETLWPRIQHGKEPKE